MSVPPPYYGSNQNYPNIPGYPQNGPPPGVGQPAGYPQGPGFGQSGGYPQGPGYGQPGAPPYGQPNAPGYGPPGAPPFGPSMQPGFMPPGAAFGMRGPTGFPGSTVVNDDDGPKDNETGQFGSSFDSVVIRHRFVRRVYTILSIQLLFTAGLIAAFTFSDKPKFFVIRNPWTLYLSCAVFMAVYLALACCSNLRRKSPLNIILLVILTIAMGFMTATTSSFYQTEIVLLAVGITAIVCICVTLFSMQTKYDFTKCGGFLCVASLVLMIFGLFAIFLRNQFPILHIVYAGLSALLFTMFLAFDTQMIMGGKKIELSPEEYVLGALQLYVDIIYIFLNILQLLGYANKN